MDLEWLEHTEARAYEAQFRMTPPNLGLQFEQHGELFQLFSPKMDVFMFNRLLGTDWSQEWEKLLEPHREANLKRYGVQIPPPLLSREMQRRLEAAGLVHSSNWVKMYRPARDAPEVQTPFRIERIDSCMAQHFAEVVTLGFQMPAFLRPWLQQVIEIPGWVSYLAFDGNTPVAAGALHVQSEVGWLGMGCTLPEYRNRGAQGAIMRCRIRDALDLGCKWVVAETGEETPKNPNPSYHNMVRMGFKLAYARPNFIPAT